MRLWCLAALVAMGLITAGVAEAIPTLSLTDGLTFVTIEDNGFDDLDPTPGIVAYAGSIGIFDTSFSVGSTTPALGSPASPMLEINTFAASSSDAGSLFVAFSETDFTGPGPAAFLSEFTGTAGLSTGGLAGVASLSTFYGGDNLLFSEATPLGAFIESDTFAVSSVNPSPGAAGPYSLTAVLAIIHDTDISGGEPIFTEISGSISAAPEPASVSLFLLGGAALGWIRRRR